MEQLPKFVRERLQKGRAGDHPDPDLLAAFAENALLESERPRVVEHLSRCAECREVVMLATSADDHAAAVATPHPASGLATVQTASRAWFRRPVLRWAALAACVALAVVIVVRHEWNGTRPAETDLAARVAHPQPDAQRKAKIPSKAENQTLPAAAAKPRKSTLSASAVPSPANRRARRANRHTASAPANALATGPQNRSAAKASPHLALVPPAELKKMSPQPAVGEVTGNSAEAQTLSAFSPAASASKPGVQTPRSPAMAGGVIAGVPGGLPAAQRVPAATRETAGNTKPRQWTISPEGSLERSADSGNTWTKVEVGDGARFRALSALGPNIWAGGANGLLFHSPDAGAHWTQVHPVASGVPLTSTIVHIDFTSAREGRLSTGDGETWTTTDAGLTWKKQ